MAIVQFIKLYYRHKAVCTNVCMQAYGLRVLILLVGLKNIFELLFFSFTCNVLWVNVCILFYTLTVYQRGSGCLHET